MCACKKEGPEGKQGAKGDKGEQGIQGIPGNAGAKMYVYGEKTTTTARFQYTIPIPFDEIKNCLIHAYFLDGGSTIWMPVPGTNNMMSFLTLCGLSRAFEDTETDYIVVLSKISDASQAYYTSTTFKAFRIIVVPIPEANITEVKGAAPVDYSNYAEVAKYYGLPE
jgi:hypothetical protein